VLISVKDFEKKTGLMLPILASPVWHASGANKRWT